MDSLLSVCGKSESIIKKIIFLKPHLIVYIFAFSDTLVSVRNVILVTVRTVVWVGVVKLLIQSLLNCNQLSCNFRLHGIFCTAMFVVMVMVLLLVVVRMGGGVLVCAVLVLVVLDWTARVCAAGARARAWCRFWWQLLLDRLYSSLQPRLLIFEDTFREEEK